MENSTSWFQNCTCPLNTYMKNSRMGLISIFHMCGRGCAPPGAITCLRDYISVLTEMLILISKVTETASSVQEGGAGGSGRRSAPLHPHPPGRG